MRFLRSSNLYNIHIRYFYFWLLWGAPPAYYVYKYIAKMNYMSLQGWTAYLASRPVPGLRTGVRVRRSTSNELLAKPMTISLLTNKQ